MKGQTRYISALLPRDLLLDLSINEEDFVTANEETGQNSTFTFQNPRRCISEDTIHPIIPTISCSSLEFQSSYTSSESSSSPSDSPINEQKSFLRSTKKNASFPESKEPFIFEYEVGYNNLTFKQFLQIPKNKQNLPAIIQSCPGSHLLQKMIKTIEPSDIDTIFQLIKQDIKKLMCDNYGNYFLQKLITKLNKVQRLNLLNLIKDNFFEISNDISGTHCIQALIEAISSKEEEEIIKSYIEKNLMDLTISQNSTHIIQKLINKKVQYNRYYLIQFCLENFVQLSLNFNGASVIKKLISEITLEHLRNIILSILEKNFLKIVESQFGNYVIQDAIEYFGYQSSEKIIMNIINNSVYFSLQKYSSNVIDKIAIKLQANNKFLFKQLIEDMIINQSNLLVLIKNKYGMYVLTNLIKLMTKQEKEKIKSFFRTSCNFFLNNNNSMNNNNFYLYFNNTSKLSKFLCLLN